MPASKIVVVDDDEAIRSIVCAVAHEAVPGATIDEFPLAVQALEDVKRGDANLLITNCHMPDMDGPSLVKAVREMKNSIPIIMVSGSTDARGLGEQAGIDKFVDKVHINAELPDAIHLFVPKD